MLQIKGKHNTAVVYADQIDPAAKTQLASLLREEAYAHARIRVMPDVHAGRNCVIGLTVTLKKRVNPALLGTDIGCGVEAAVLRETEFDPAALDALIRSRIPCGSRIREMPAQGAEFPEHGGLACRDAVDRDMAERSLGTLGGGNHFIEVERDEAGKLYLLIHSGSRRVGADMAAYYADQAYRAACRKARRIGRSRPQEDEVGGFVRTRTARAEAPRGRGEAILEGALYDAYLQDVQILCRFAEANRRWIAELICRGMGWHIEDRFSCVHNYIDETGTLRKGAVSARQGERLIIPMNMRDGALFCRGLGNPEWNFSAPHGAGRIASREDVRRAWSVADYREAMAGIYTTTATAGSLDECPMAYKSPASVEAYLSAAAEITGRGRVLYNFKAD